MSSHTPRLIRTLCALAIVAAGCAGGSAGPVAGDSLSVFAAASLSDAFGELAAAFERVDPEARVALNLGPSSGLREQILAGAPADVYASADQDDMKRLVDAGLVREASVFVHNDLQIAVPAGNPARVRNLGDFGRSELLIGICAQEVPCGRFAREALRRAGVTSEPDTNALNVRALLTQIENGELDAGVVYRTDVLSARDKVEGIDIPADQNVTAAYPIAALTNASDVDRAAAFVAFVLSDQGRRILASYGFVPA